MESRRRIYLRMPIDKTAAGIDAETVIPTRSPRYALAAPKTTASKRPSIYIMLVRNLKYTTYLKQCHYTKLCFGIIIYLIYKLNCEIVYDNRLGIFLQENVSQNTDTVSIEGLDTIRNYTDDYAAISGLNVLGARGLEIP